MENNEFKVGNVSYRIVPIDDINERGIDFGGMADGIGEAAKLVAESVIVLKGDDSAIVKAAKVTKLAVGFVGGFLKKSGIQAKVVPVKLLEVVKAMVVIGLSEQTVWLLGVATPTGSGVTVTVAVKSLPTQPAAVGVMV